jgi:4-alpha-glucanotransferase
MLALAIVAAQAAAATAAAALPLPTAKQLAFMDMDTIQFMHFSVDTAWKPPSSYLHSGNPTYHNCVASVTGTSHDNQTGRGYWPCLDPIIFNPDKLDPDQWMAASAALGMKEICITG